MTYAPPAIERTAQLAALCPYCGSTLASCAPLWAEQRKCCPDCAHGRAPRPLYTQRRYGRWHRVHLRRGRWVLRCSGHRVGFMAVTESEPSALEPRCERCFSREDRG